MSLGIHIDKHVPASGTYRSERVRSMFNATDEQATRFTLDMDLPLDLDGDWQIGAVVGPSGTGKSSIGRTLWDGAAWYDAGEGWPAGVPVVDAIAPGGSLDDVTSALAQAGLGDVPVWLRPYEVLSTGQRFRADLARVLAEAPDRIVFDEFTSVVDRQIAQVGAGAFGKAWRRTGGKAVLLSCHYDILDWLEPDWVIDTASHTFQTNADREGERRWKRPRITVEVRLGGWDLWPFFKQHHYLDLPPMVGGKCYVGFVDDEPVCHLGVATKNVNVRVNGRVQSGVEARASRLVVLPEWQGAGVGTRFLNHVADLQYRGEGVLPRGMTTVFHTSHPQLSAALRRSPYWRQISAMMHGGSKAKSRASLEVSAHAKGSFSGTGMGGHLRAVTGFRYGGQPYADAAAS